MINTTVVDRRCKEVQSALFKQAYYQPAVKVAQLFDGCALHVHGGLVPAACLWSECTWRATLTIANVRSSWAQLPAASM
eukprot:COSAG01_NODE_2575_length_7433_cov_10.052495_9_plen_79_part_00